MVPGAPRDAVGCSGLALEPELKPYSGMSAAIEAKDPQREKVAFAQLRERAHALIPALKGRADSVERNRRVSDETIAMLRQADLFKLMQPARFGGFEYGLSELIEINLELGQGCGATAWCASLTMAGQWMVGLFPLEVQEEIWGIDPGTILAHQLFPIGTCARAPGGFRLSGQWPFTSNCDNAPWFLFGATFPDSAAESYQGYVVLPRSQVEIIDDWFVVGLAGTGSKTVAVRDAFVPAHRVLKASDLEFGCAPGARLHSAPIYKVAFRPNIPFCVATPALGMVQGAIDDFAHWATSHARVSGSALAANSLAQVPHVQTRLAEAAALLDCALLLMRRDAREVEECARRGEEPPLESRLRNRRDHAYVARLMVSAIDLLFEPLGAHALPLSSPIQRAWRDVHAAAHHVTVDFHTNGAMYGQWRLGLPPKGIF
jgi:alkylation response protein AidB-like acyl-CoA dehydrogenase